MPVPIDAQPDLARFLEQLDRRLRRLEAPQGFTPVFLTTSTNLTAASAGQMGGRFGVATDLKTIVFSNGAHWFRVDTGAQIV